MTSSDFEMRIRDKNTVFVIPTGSLEQHGPHLPILTDSIIASEVLKHVRDAISQKASIVILPTIPYGCSYEHIDTFGTISIRLDTYLKLLGDIIESLSRIGAKKIAIANAHGGNSNILRALVSEFSDKYNVFIAVIEIFKLATSIFLKYKESTEIGAFHAGELETSLMLYLNDKLVRKDKVAKGIPQKFFDKDSYFYLMSPKGIGRFSWKTKEISKTGIIGDATLATKEKGEKIFKELVNEVSNILLEYYNMSV